MVVLRQRVVRRVLADDLRRLARVRELELAGLTWSKMSLAFVFRVISKLSMLFSRLRVVGRLVVVRVPVEPDISSVRVEARDRLHRVQLVMSTASEPSIMYGPDEITKRPYSPAFMKHFATSSGIGPAAGIASRYSKSPVGFSRVKAMVLSSGVWMPAIGLLAVRRLRRPPASEYSWALDDAQVVEAVLRDERGRPDAPQGVLDVLRRHLAAHRRAEHDAVTDREGVRQAVLGDLRLRLGEVGSARCPPRRARACSP